MLRANGSEYCVCLESQGWSASSGMLEVKCVAQHSMYGMRTLNRENRLCALQHVFILVEKTAGNQLNFVRIKCSNRQ